MIFKCSVCDGHDLVVSNKKQDLVYMVIINDNDVDCIWPEDAEDQSSHFECLTCGTNLPIVPTKDALISYLTKQSYNKE